MKFARTLKPIIYAEGTSPTVSLHKARSHTVDKSVWSFDDRSTLGHVEANQVDVQIAGQIMPLFRIGWCASM